MWNNLKKRWRTWNNVQFWWTQKRMMLKSIHCTFVHVCWIQEHLLLHRKWCELHWTKMINSLKWLIMLCNQRRWNRRSSLIFDLRVIWFKEVNNERTREYISQKKCMISFANDEMNSNWLNNFIDDVVEIRFEFVHVRKRQ